MPELTPSESSAASPPLALLDQLVARIETGALDLPLLPQTATQILALCQAADCEMKELADLVQRDPTLAANVLRVANSAAHGGVERIVSLQQAASRLGFTALCEIATAVALRGKVFQLAGREAELARIWRHSAAAGAWAKEIARKRRRNVEGAFLCGLLHDVGRPVLMQLVHELAGPAAGASVRGEDQLYDRYHAEVGARLLVNWQMPDWMIAAIDAHHEPHSAEEHAEPAWIVALADDFAHWSESGDEARAAALRRHAALEPLSLYDEDVDALFALRAQVAAATEALG
ncbi:MAG: HDOD domain-containing protein [Planctomycetota bacterium]|nr:MAG: HDOD domain-containing protein [Planctomycetota bacterium]